MVQAVNRKKNIGYPTRWRYSVEMTPDDADERPGFMFLYDEPMEDIEFDHQPTEKEMARAISKQGYKTSSANTWYSEIDGILSFKGETDDGKFFFSVDPYEDNPKLTQADIDRFWPRRSNPLRSGFWRPEPPHGPEAHDLAVKKLDLKKLKDTRFVVAVHGRSWAPCSIIIARVFDSGDPSLGLVYSTRDERDDITRLDSTDEIYEIAMQKGWSGPLSYTRDQVREMLDRVSNFGPWKGLTSDEKDDASEFFDDREDEAFDDPGYF